MLVSVHCFASLADRQPAPPEMTLPENARVSDVVARLGIPDGAQVIVLMDKGPASLDTPLHQGASLELLPIVEGG